MAEGGIAFRGMREEALREIAAHLYPPAPEWVIDVGGGTGEVGQALKEFVGGRWVILDRDAEALLGAMRRGICCVMGDANAAPFNTAGRRSAVLFLNSLHQMSNFPEVLQEWYANCGPKDGLQVVMFDHGSVNLWEAEYFPAVKTMLQNQPTETRVIAACRAVGLEFNGRYSILVQRRRFDTRFISWVVARPTSALRKVGWIEFGIGVFRMIAGLRRRRGSRQDVWEVMLVTSGQSRRRR